MKNFFSDIVALACLIFAPITLILNIINAAVMISGLLVNAGVGLLVLFRVNRNLKENIKITAMLYIIGVISGIVLQLIGFTI